ncbi:MAG: hypothetical protein ACK5JU_07925 [Bacteroidales bacterium]
MASLNDILSWFKSGLFPTEQQFSDTWLSFWHKSEKIPQDQIFGLKETIESATKGLIYQNPVTTAADLPTTYPTALPGWASMVTTEGYIYSFNGTTWASTGLKAFPEDVVTADKIVQTTGTSDTAVISQKGVTEFGNGLVSFNAPFDIVGSVNSVGFFTTNAAARRTDYVVAFEGMRIVAYDGAAAYTSYRACAFFDINKVFISALSFEIAGIKAIVLDSTNIPEGAVYIVSSTLLEYVNSSFLTWSMTATDLLKLQERKLNKSAVKQGIGTSLFDLMSQKAITDFVNSINPYTKPTNVSDSVNVPAGSRVSRNYLITNKQVKITINLTKISGTVASTNYRIYFSKTTTTEYLAYNNIPYGQSVSFYLPDEYTGVTIFQITTASDACVFRIDILQDSIFNDVKSNAESIASINTDIDTINAEIDNIGSTMTLPINVFGNILPTNFKSKFFSGEKDVEIVCVGDSLTGLIQYCTAFSADQIKHLPPGMTHNHWVYQLWNRINLNKPICNRVDTPDIYTIIGAFTEIWNEKFDLPTKNGEYSYSALTFQNTALNASVSFNWDLDTYAKCNIVYSANQDGALTEIVIGDGTSTYNGLIQVSLDKENWIEANGYELNQNTIPSGSTYTEANAYLAGVALHQRHRRIWMRKTDLLTGIISITYQRKSTDTDVNHCTYFWGTEMWNQQSVFITNLGRGGRNIDILHSNISDVSDRNPDLLMLEMPLANETSKASFQLYKPQYNLYFFSETSPKGSVKTRSNNFSKFDVMMVLPHGRSLYFNGNQAVIYGDGNVDEIINHIQCKAIFTYIEGLSSDVRSNFACVNLMDQLYNEGLSRGLNLQSWLAGSVNNSTLTQDGIHLNDFGSMLWSKYLSPIFQ